ncbi:MAG: Gfo/Idh/MocA family oxidoreductase [Chloroflexota bacterium]|nr:Gfo/Idh/MocA family oxidoreductase [Chloroflexota bacterium]
MTAFTTPIRIGVLGAARIVPAALIHPARLVAGVKVTTIAARDPARAQRFAAAHGIPRTHATYADVIADPDVDAVYIPLPNSLHHRWTLAALETGKHVLCEKPLAANAAEAAQTARAAEQAGLVSMEAFHYRYHPLAARMKAIIDSGELGTVRRIETRVCFPLLRRNDIRFRYDLAGGAMMDAGCYAVHIARFLAGAEPAVVAAQAHLRSEQVDRRVVATLAFPDGVSGRVECSLFSRKLLDVQAIVTGDRGVMRVINPVLPHLFHCLFVRTTERLRWERVFGRSTYAHQLEAFVSAVRTGTPPLTGSTDALANMRVIDDVYAAAGLQLRGT